MIKIKQYKNLYIVDTPKIEKYLTEIEVVKGKKTKVVEHILDIESNEFKKANKKPLKTFNILARVTKVVDRKQKSKKKTFKYVDLNDVTLTKALENIKANELDKLINSIQSDAELKEHKKKKQAEIEAEKKENAQNQILNTVWDEFYNHKVNGTDAELGVWKPTTARNYKSFYNKWVKDVQLGATPVKEVTKEQISALVTKIKSEKSLRTASTTIEVLKPVFDWYFEKHKINLANPVPRKKKTVFDLKNERVIGISVPQVRKLYKTIDTYEDELFRKVFLWLRTGRRRGEILTLQMEHIDTIEKTFLIEAKNNKANEDMTYVLREELEATLPEKFKLSDYLFESTRIKGQPIHPDSVTKHWDKIKEKTKGTFKLNGKTKDIKELHLHDIRHIINGILKKAEVPQETREKVLGHINTSTNDRYGEAYYGDAGRAYQLFLDIVYGVVAEDMKWGKYAH